MKLCWQKPLLDGLEALDRQEGPHGVYGIRQAYSAKERLPSLAHLFSSSGQTNVLRPIGLQGIQSRFGSDDLRFSAEGGECVSLQVLDWATTKVRHYGSTYRMDGHHGKEPRTPDWELESLVPRLSSRSRGVLTMGILLVAHYASAKELQSLLGRSARPEFLKRYEVAHFSRGWGDRYGRDFQTAVHLWTPQTCHQRLLATRRTPPRYPGKIRQRHGAMILTIGCLNESVKFFRSMNTLAAILVAAPLNGVRPVE